MKISSKFSLALLAGTILSTPANYAAAVTLTPTLDTLKAEAADLSGSYALTELSGELPAGAAEVEIAGVKYYFTPEGEDAALLATLAGTSAGNLIEAADGIFELNGKKYSFNTAAIPASAFEYAEGTAEDYNFIVKEADDEGNLTDKYYKINLKPEKFSASESITWGEAEQTGDSSDSVAVNLPNNQTQTFYYAYNKPADYTETGTRIDNTLGTANVTGVVFKGISTSSNGGAIYNTQDHGDINITADFIGNYTDEEGGAIYNDDDGIIGNITGNFISNSVSGFGGAIDNSGTIGNIIGNFIGNYAENGSGGAIYSYRGTINNITGSFIGNHTSYASGGAIDSLGATIGALNSHFIGNYVSANYAKGGAIYTIGGTFGDIIGDFVGNYASGRYTAEGGAIYNASGGSYVTAFIGNITGDFIGNRAVASANNGSGAGGGAIFNHSSQDMASIGNITGNFINNYASVASERGSSSGGAIYNNAADPYSSSVKMAVIGDITGDFVGNHASGSYTGNGGAIFNNASSRGTATIGNIIGNFVGNHASGSHSAHGGAIYNSMSDSAAVAASIGNITGNFVGNYALGSSSSSGGAIYTTGGTIGNITGDFISNYTSGSGGAIYNSAQIKQSLIGNITGDFIANHAFGSGGAIYNQSSSSQKAARIGNITGNFIGNYTEDGSGGAIYNYTEGGSPIGNIKGNFINNYANKSGGAIYNSNSISDVPVNAIGNIDGNFNGNYTTNGSGGAIYNRGNAALGNITGDFVGNHASESGGAIYNDVFYVTAGKVGIGNITGNFINNYVSGSDAAGGAIFNSSNVSRAIGDVRGDFIGNYVFGTNTAQGGAVYYELRATIDSITSNFIENHAESISSYAQGGAIMNIENSFGGITGDFIGNYAQSSNSYASGGAIYNYDGGNTGNITGNFYRNYVSAFDNALGGAIYNDGRIKNITGDFSGNYAKSTEGNAAGGVIYNIDYGTIDNIVGDFISNYAESKKGSAYGGAVYSDVKVTVKDPDMPDNLIYHITVQYGDKEMEVYLPMGNPEDGSMQLINGTLTVGSEEEFLAYKQYAVYTQVLKLDPANITAADYIDIMIQAGDIPEDKRDEALAKFEALSPEEQKEALSEIRQMAELIQTMINNATPVKEITTTTKIDGGMIFYNSSFRNNHVKAANGKALGGAIYGSGIMITADKYNSIVDGNKANEESNAFYVLNKIGTVSFDGSLTDLFPDDGLDLDLVLNMSAAGDLTLTTLNNGVILLNDGIDGESGYGIAMNGDKGIEEESLRTPQYVKLNNSIANAGSIYLSSTTLSLGTGPYGKGEIVSDGDPVTKVSLQNAAFDIYNGYRDTVNLAGWNASNGYLHIDVDTDNLTADVLNITGDVAGQTKVIVYASSTADITGKSILFATATGAGSEDSFSVYRVYNSPYMFDVTYNPDGTTGKEWSLTMNDEKDNEYAGILPDHMSDPEIPDIDDPDTDIPTAPSKVYAEVVAYGALPAAALEQTRNMVDNIGGQVAAARTHDAAANYNLWVNPTYYTSNIDSPFAIDADIWGIEAGGDIQRDVHNRLGIFVSYRQGEYDMSGNGDKYRSPVGSEIDIDSYIAGLYYRYDHNNWYAFATLYGGIQEADIKTDDGMKSDTDGVEFGASAEVGYDYALTDSVTLTPELGVFYTQVNYDDAEDNVGKSASYDDARQIELEAGVKLAKTFMTDESFANVYVKPSVVQTIVDGDEVNISGLGNVETLDDATLGRIELGGRYGFTTSLSAYGWVNYTFGSDYDATTFGLGLNYAF